MTSFVIFPYGKSNLIFLHSIWNSYPFYLIYIILRVEIYDIFCSHENHIAMSLSLWQALVENRTNDTRLCLKWTANKDLLYSTWNSDQCYVVAWMGRGLSPLTIHLKLSQQCLFIGLLLIQNKRLKKIL